VAHRNSGALSVLVIGNGVLTLARSLERNHDTVDPFDEMLSDLYATRVYVEDQTGVRPDRLYLAGFGDDMASGASRIAARLSAELDVETEIVPDEYPGLAGYLRSLSPAATAARKVAA
jgi:hypothetical protein